MNSVGQKILDILNTPRGKYKYIGVDPKFRGHTALGELRRSVGFCIQVDDQTHYCSRGWYLAVREDWELIKEDR